MCIPTIPPPSPLPHAAVLHPKPVPSILHPPHTRPLHPSPFPSVTAPSARLRELGGSHRALTIGDEVLGDVEGDLDNEGAAHV